MRKARGLYLPNCVEWAFSEVQVQGLHNSVGYK
jgi:hypothetical protein